MVAEKFCHHFFFLHQRRIKKYGNFLYRCAIMKKRVDDTVLCTLKLFKEYQS